jgi:hypothetical protein
MKPLLFHKIGAGGEDSAAIRRFIVERELDQEIEFFNVTYPSAAGQLRELTGTIEVPCLVADKKIIRGKEEILTWLEAY